MTKQALLFGATGAVGSQLLELCLESEKYKKVSVIARRPATVEHAKLNWIECEYDALHDLAPLPGLAGGDAYCCLGTTIKTAGSREKFRLVDHDYVINAAGFARACKTRNFSVVSALGADAKSANFYSRTKGEVEAALIAENLPSLRIFRPSLLKGKRSEFRLGEEIGNALSVLLTPVFALGFRKYQPIEIGNLAWAMYQTSTDESIGDSVRIFENDELQSF